MATDEADTPGTTLDFTGTIRTTDLTGVAIDDIVLMLQILENGI